ncbi:MAG: gamma-glutamyltransferase [Vicinamibacterales bacterium]|nr:gamma-glutamyltransferase [Vicinamibacterales bacterium]
MTTALAQSPGDRPAANPRATRSVVMARQGAIATSQPLASAAGLHVLASGGNAIDAAVTAAAVLAVVEPPMNGIGGDLFALVYNGQTQTLHGLNASGRAGSGATPEAFAALGLSEMPDRGPLPVTVPGAVDGWHELLQAHGTISLAQALAPAIAYARDGFVVSEIIAGQWRDTEAILARDDHAARVFLPGGAAPRPGDIFRNPALAATLQTIAAGGRDAFYTGPIGRAIAGDLARRGGHVTAADIAAHRSDWVTPISTNYRGYDVFELPPNTQGIVALEMLNILEGFDLKALGHNSAAYLHLLVEAKRIAFADRGAYLADPGSVPASTLQTLLSKEYAAQRRREIDPSRAGAGYAPGAMPSATGGSGGPLPRFDNVREGRDRGDTIYLTAADGQGNVVSLIQSLYESFGAGIVAGDTGIVLHDRGAGFRLDAGHPNRIAPGKRPMHTLVPAMVLKDRRPWLSFGVMGGDMQPQGHVQVLLNLIEFGMNIQEAGEAPRFRHMTQGVALESALSAEARSGLTTRGHTVIQRRGAFGGFQGILIDPVTGVLMAGSDPRKDGLAIGR